MTATNSSNVVLDINNLVVGLGRKADAHRIIDDLSLQVREGETLCLVGESGSGKSVTSLTTMGLLQKGTLVPSGGSVKLVGEELLTASDRRLRQLRATRMAMIFQEPMTALNPVVPVGRQIDEVLRAHTDLDARARRRKILAMMEHVRLPDVERIFSSYPHRLSGGQRQRIMIAMALVLEPKLLIADEPTTALDVTVQAQIFDLLSELQDDTDTAIVLITHDLGAVAELADDVAVLYAGRCIEQGAADGIIAHARHPYTRGLMACVPHLQLGKTDSHFAALEEIPGMVPPLGARGPDCAFLARCAFAADICRAQPQPPLDRVDAHAAVSCWRHQEIAP